MKIVKLLVTIMAPMTTSLRPVEDRRKLQPPSQSVSNMEQLSSLWLSKVSKACKVSSVLRLLNFSSFFQASLTLVVWQSLDRYAGFSFTMLSTTDASKKKRGPLWNSDWLNRWWS